MARQFARAVVRAGQDIDRATPHTMRRTAITRLVQAGVDLPTIQKISGHKTLAMLLRHVNLHDPHIDAAISNLGSGFPDAITQGLQTPGKPAEPSTGGVIWIKTVKSAA